MPKVRKGVLIVSTVCFAAMATGAALCGHLWCAEHPEEHDFGHCSICKRILASCSSFDIEPQIWLVDTIAEQDRPVLRQDIIVSALLSLTVHPRAPPATS